MASPMWTPLDREYINTYIYAAPRARGGEARCAGQQIPRDVRPPVGAHCPRTGRWGNRDREFGVRVLPRRDLRLPLACPPRAIVEVDKDDIAQNLGAPR